jgi:hypothetical protein
MRIARCLLILVLAGIIAGCTSSAEKTQQAIDSPMVVKSKVEPGVDFSQFETWAWVPLKAEAQIDSRIDSPEFKTMLKDAVEREMYTRGYRRVEVSEQPSLLVNVHATVEDIDAKYIDEHYDGDYYPEYRTEIGGKKLSEEWKEGSVIIILFDTKTMQAVWGGGVQTEAFEDLPEDARRQRVDKGVRQIMDTLPRRK